MGNLCGKSSKDDNFQGAGRTLNAAPAPATKASIPASAKPKVTGPGRTVGGPGGSDGANDPRAAAAAAAEARANKPVTGDLAKKLEEQKKQTRNQTLQQAADENRLQREADAATETRNYN
ncbi:hypothetical protein DPSP01_000287 [Paraphaeosphaeria sporulosa]|uniref:Uncharacterized protein n=1 Tax=Paraphaeosphaeria sporulosa TaxID=1460663 RepID=A0A177CZP2_9PLEO|nr:uncharacterized protein CC84DRAFT_1160032 [Paraphaeosphaeria sporulosa]OAG12776.1 hypothetical protein CC84DRAFT_1160032 [Paraphaeosphaeria sporulosa]